MKLSILIPTLNERWEQFSSLVKTIKEQGISAGYAFMKDFEIVAPMDNRCISVGAKRNMCLEMSRGMYTCFFDDDDLPGPTYMKDIMDGINIGVQNGRPYDCIGFKGR